MPTPTKRWAGPMDEHTCEQCKARMGTTEFTPPHPFCENADEGRCRCFLALDTACNVRSEDPDFEMHDAVWQVQGLTGQTLYSCDDCLAIGVRSLMGKRAVVRAMGASR